ncbi:uncharacterized protein LOC128231893 [Mya arenaria]|uniref:uncharacterized protein LOC128231893 n=1 Tax=Mya arenaria TaxID=6604 RepID=UPI0022DFA33C|nr:uncharacterized protein LOC128231893 [Mya arenaria]
MILEASQTYGFPKKRTVHLISAPAKSHNDTTCERCVNGKTFSNISSEVTPCQNCSLCTEGWVQKFPCHETEDTVCIPKVEVDGDSFIIIPLGVIYVVVIAAVMISYCFWKRIDQFFQNLCSSQEKHDDELKPERRNQENHDDEEQANPLQQDRRLQENHDDEEQATPLQQERRRQENHVDEEQAIPVQQDRRRQANHDDEEQANLLQQDKRRQENLDDVNQANLLQQGGTPDKSEVNISTQQLRIPPCFTL